MSRFVKAGSWFLNVDHIVQVYGHEDGFVTILMDNGESIKADSDVGFDIMGKHHITAIIPSHGNLWARMEQDGREFDIAVEHLVLTADGSYYPLEAALLVEESRGDVTYNQLLADDGDDDEEYMRQNAEDDEEILSIYLDSPRC